MEGILTDNDRDAPSPVGKLRFCGKSGNMGSYVKSAVSRIVLIVGLVVAGTSLCPATGNPGRSSPVVRSQCPGNPVQVHPGDNLQTLVTACPSGTSFNLMAGVHHDSVTSIPSNDVFNGVPGAIENGANTLTGWSQVTINSVVYWTTAGGTPILTHRNSSYCQSGYAGCYYPQDLYLDSVTQIHVTSLTDVTPGKWYYDYAGGDGGVVNNIYLANTENPKSHTVELGVLIYAFQSDNAKNITIQGLTLEKYAGQIDQGTIHVNHLGCGGCTASGWVIQNNEIRLSRMAGVGIGSGTSNIQILNNSIHDMGQYGIEGGGNVIGTRCFSSGSNCTVTPATNITVTGNKVYNNNTDKVDRGYGAGGQKFGATNNSVVSYNTVYDNGGGGLWSDDYCFNITYDHNVVYDNVGQGIRLEISDQQAVTNNVVYGNGTGGSNAQIVSANSSHLTASGNVVTVPNKQGAKGLDIEYDNRRQCNGPGTCTVPVGMYLHKNCIILSSTGTTSGSSALDNSSPSTFSLWSGNVHFDANSYIPPSSSPSSNNSWQWGQLGTGTYTSFARWRSLGQDQHAAEVTQNCRN